MRGGVAGSGGHIDSAEALQVERVTPRVEHVGVERLDDLVGSDVVADGGALVQRPAAVVPVDLRHHKDAQHSCRRQHLSFLRLWCYLEQASVSRICKTPGYYNSIASIALETNQIIGLHFCALFLAFHRAYQALNQQSLGY